MGQTNGFLPYRTETRQTRTLSDVISVVKKASIYFKTKIHFIQHSAVYFISPILWGFGLELILCVPVFNNQSINQSTLGNLGKQNNIKSPTQNVNAIYPSHESRLGCISWERKYFFAKYRKFFWINAKSLWLVRSFRKQMRNFSNWRKPVEIWNINQQSR